MDNRGMSKSIITYFTKTEVEHIKQNIFAHCHWSDTVMNRFEDFFEYLDFPDESVLELRGELISTKPTKLGQMQIQRKSEL